MNPVARPPRRYAAARARAGLTLLVLALLTAGCSGPADPDARPGGASGATQASTPIALSPDGSTLWVVNPDSDSVTAVDLPSLSACAPISVGGEPWAVAAAPDGTVVVMNRRDGSLTFLVGAARYDLAVGPEPGGLALSPDGATAFVTISADAELAVVDVATRRVVGRVPVGPLPWAVATSGTGDAAGEGAGADIGDDYVVIVGHRLARPVEGRLATADDGREGWLTVVRGFGVAAAGEPRDLAAASATITSKEVVLPANPFGFPNALEALAVSGARGEGQGLASTAAGEPLVYVAHQLDSPAGPNDFMTSVSAGLSTLALSDGALEPVHGLDLNDPTFSTPVNFPRAVAAAPDRATLYLALAGTDAVMGVDVSSPGAPELIGFWPAGSNPRGIAVSGDGQHAYVMNYLSRDVSVLDLSDPSQRRELARVSVADEPLPAAQLRGKRLFNNANDPRLSLNGWLSCASCHLDGGGDGTTWPREEGERQTMPLWALAGTAPFHSAASRDEIQDFEADIERFMAGVGLAPGAAGPLLGAPSAGGSADLDALAAFVLHGIRTPTAPSIDSAATARGRTVFAARGCHSCHAGPAWTTSQLPGPVGTLAPGGEQVVAAAVHDVGTFVAEHDVTGADGFDTPTLLGLAYTAPYFHDGSASDLGAVLAHPGHSGAPLPASDRADLISFLRSIDASSEPFPLP